jgi:ribose transport system substrate-binding protein
MRKILATFLALTMVLTLTFAATALAETKAPGDLSLYLVTTNGSATFWQDIKKGMEAANAELGTNCQFTGPMSYDESQVISAIDRVLGMQPDGIIISVGSDATIEPIVKRAKEQGTVIVTIDADTSIEGARACYVGISNYEAGYSGGELMAKLTNGKAVIGALTGVVGVPTLDARQEGFAAAIAAYPDMQIVAREQTNADALTAAEKTKMIMTAHPEITGIYCDCGPDGAGIAQSLIELGRSDVTVIGFDDSEQTLDYIRSGVIAASTYQDGYAMGYEGVKNLVKAINGETVEDTVTVGVVMITKDNVDDYKNY